MTIMTRKSGFTLIELLIVVAIIGILAAIAIPNFLQAQVRARVARSQADMRELKNALYIYHTDHNNWPSDTYTGTDPNAALGGWSVMFSLQELSTPVEYLSQVPFSDTFSSTPQPGGTYANHYQYWYDTFAAPPSNIHTGTLWEEDEWVIAAPGPSQNWPPGFNITVGYDPSNGTVSPGITWVSTMGIFGGL